MCAGGLVDKGICATCLQFLQARVEARARGLRDTYHVSFGQGDHLCRWNVLVLVKVLRETEPIGIYRDTQEEINYGNGLTQFGG